MSAASWVDRPNPKHEKVDWYEVFADRQIDRRSREEIQAQVDALAASLGMASEYWGYRLPGGGHVQLVHMSAGLDRYRYCISPDVKVDRFHFWVDAPVLARFHEGVRDLPRLYGEIVDVSDPGDPLPYKHDPGGFGRGGILDTKGT